MTRFFTFCILIIMVSCAKEHQDFSADFQHYDSVLTNTETTIYNDTILTRKILNANVNPKDKDAVSKLLAKCQILCYQGNSAQCDSIARTAIKLAKQNNDEVGNYFANTFRYTANYYSKSDNEAQKVYYEFYERTKKGNPKFHENVVNNLIYSMLGISHDQKFSEYLDEQYTLAKQLNDSLVWCNYYSNKAYLYYEKYENDSLDLVISNMDKALRFCQKGNYQAYYAALFNRENFKSKPNPEVLKQCLTESARYHFFDPNYYVNLLYYYTSENDVPNSIYYYELSQKKLLENKDYYSLYVNNENMYNMYKSLNDAEKALHYKDLSYKYERLCDAKDRRDKINELEWFYKSKEIKHDLYVKKIENIVLIIFAGVLLISFFGYWVFNVGRKRRQHQKYLELMNKLNEKNAVVTPENTGGLINPDYEADDNTKITVEEEVIEKIVNGLKKMEKKHDFLKPDFRLAYVAKKINTNTTYLSSYFNNYKKQTFSEYTQELRINYVLAKIKEDPIFRKYTLQAIAEEIGYREAATFVRIFKKYTGISPSFFIEEIEKDKSG
ncbi:MAG: hypothetical protein CFE23_01120 [Flavobacterium sp. BFFFF1]|uniref:helix-turn-helix domain-containing protein n=1 Tax=Flavobacterium sp. BFFFF1 TaxID=2015557 RepID=UPI000BDAA432|nr:helix-turn-helix domain-containing protein [Flavobacterium sp. BFFFF1]OYU82349.1 MAG: hypothetical protein CFE23_01120 [Flavobacterium sp. BFFFF1]